MSALTDALEAEGFYRIYDGHYELTSPIRGGHGIEVRIATHDFATGEPIKPTVSVLMAHDGTAHEVAVDTSAIQAFSQTVHLMKELAQIAELLQRVIPLLTLSHVEKKESGENE